LEADPEVLAELRQIRRAQEEMLAEYRRVANTALEIQKQAFETQQRAVAQQSRAVEISAGVTRIWKIALAVGAVLIAYLVYKVVRLIG